VPRARGGDLRVVAVLPMAMLCACVPAQLLSSLACQPCVSTYLPRGTGLSDCRTLGPPLSDCRTVGLSEGMLDSLTGLDSTYTSNTVGPLSDHCHAVGLSDCRTVGLSECCRSAVGPLSEPAVRLSDRGSELVMVAWVRYICISRDWIVNSCQNLAVACGKVCRVCLFTSF
jgi:hypothetical protein